MSAVSEVYLHFHPEAVAEAEPDEPRDENADRIAELNDLIANAEDEVGELEDQIHQWNREVRALEATPFNPNTVEGWQQKLNDWNRAAGGLP